MSAVAVGQLAFDDAPTQPPPLRPAAPAELGDHVTTHMETRYPDAEQDGAWTCLRDQRDNTVAILWRPTNDLLNLAGIRGGVLYRWMTSLRDAGFAVEPRLDMELWGRPHEESPDGRARWLHISGWDESRIVPERSLGELAQELFDKLGVLCEHHVTVDPDRVPALADVSGRERPVAGLSFGYQAGLLRVGADFGGDAQMVPNPPGWVLEIAAEHEGCSAAVWCNPHEVPPPEPERLLL